MYLFNPIDLTLQLKIILILFFVLQHLLSIILQLFSCNLENKNNILLLMCVIRFFWIFGFLWRLMMYPCKLHLSAILLNCNSFLFSLTAYRLFASFFHRIMPTFDCCLSGRLLTSLKKLQENDLVGKMSCF